MKILPIDAEKKWWSLFWFFASLGIFGGLGGLNLLRFARDSGNPWYINVGLVTTISLMGISICGLLVLEDTSVKKSPE